MTIHEAGSCLSFLPATVYFATAAELLSGNICPILEDFAVELERLLKQHLVLQALLIWDGNQACKVLKGHVEATLESEEHAQRLLQVVPIPSFGHPDELVQLLLRKMIGRAQEEERPLSKLLWLATTSGNQG